MTLDEEMSANRLQAANHRQQLNTLDERWRELKRQKWPKKCCRCWPSMISIANGVCGCCEYDHIKGEYPVDSTPEV